MSDDWLSQLKFDSNGLIPLIVQDESNGEILQMAYMNRTALEKTLASGMVHTYSRSRGRLAMKGETSGHFQHVRQILADCDRDVILIKVQQDVAACHEGYRSCFYRRFDAKKKVWETFAQKVFEPEKVYSSK